MAFVVVYGSLLLFVLQSGRTVWAGPCLGYPCCGECVCIPNARDFGYFRTFWRQWPTELHPRQTFPQSIGTETVPTPKGQEQLPMPEVRVPERLQWEGAPGVLPGEPPVEPPLEEGPLPVEERFQIEGGAPILPSEPAEAPTPAADAPATEPPMPVPDTPPEIQEEPAEPAPTQEEPPKKALRANWTAALNPEFRGNAGRSRGLYPSTEEQEAAPTTALDGFCPVELGKHERWTPGDPRCTAVHATRTYQFSGPAQRRLFLADPDRYAPAHSGNDLVLTVDEHRRVPGKTDYCVTYDGRLYMFSTAATRARFEKNPKRYAKAVERR